jgi:hypothetical protein
MCNIGEAIGRIFTPPGTGGQQAAATQALQAAETAQQTAIQQANVAAAGVQSNETAQLAQEARLRLLLAAGGAGATFAGGAVAAPSSGTRMLTGS